MDTKSHLVYGKWTAGVLILADIGLHLSGSRSAPWSIVVVTGIIACGVVFSILVNAPNDKGTSTWGDSFGLGFKVSVVAACLYFLYSIIALNFVFTTYIESLYQAGLANLPKEKLIAEEPSQRALAFKVLKATYLSGCILMLLAAGAISAAVGVVLKWALNKEKHAAP